MQQIAFGTLLVNTMSFAASRSVQLIASQGCLHRTLEAALSGSILQHVNTWVAPAGQHRHSSSSSSADPSSSTAIYAACVLERLPVVKSPAPEWEAEYKAWTQLRKMDEQLIKQYPTLDKKQKTRDDSERRELKLNPTVTKADASGEVSTMKRCLTDKLILLIKQRQAPTAAATGSSQAVWTFPTTAHQDGETIREAAERALKEAIGQAQVYFVGNAPMAHLDIHVSSSSYVGEAAADQAATGSSSSMPAARIFFHLAQVVNDPWDVTLADSVASEYAWVGKEELAQYIQDNAMLSLASKML